MPTSGSLYTSPSSKGSRNSNIRRCSPAESHGLFCVSTGGTALAGIPRINLDYGRMILFRLVDEFLFEVIESPRYRNIAVLRFDTFRGMTDTGQIFQNEESVRGVSLNKKVIYGQVSNCASAVTKPQTPKITSVKKAGTTKAAIQLKTERNVKGYQLYEYMWQSSLC